MPVRRFSVHAWQLNRTGLYRLRLKFTSLVCVYLTIRRCPCMHGISQQTECEGARSLTGSWRAVCGPGSAVTGDWAYLFPDCNAFPLSDWGTPTGPVALGTPQECDAACEEAGADYCSINDDNTSCWANIDRIPGGCVPGNEDAGWTKWIMCRALRNSHSVTLTMPARSEPDWLHAGVATMPACTCLGHSTLGSVSDMYNHRSS